MPGMTYNRTMRAAFIRFLRFLAWIELASVPVIYWTRGYLVWVFGPVGLTAVWWFCGFTVASALVVLVRFRVRRPAENPAARPQGDIRGGTATHGRPRLAADGNPTSRLSRFPPS